MGISRLYHITKKTNYCDVLEVNVSNITTKQILCRIEFHTVSADGNGFLAQCFKNYDFSKL